MGPQQKKKKMITIREMLGQNFKKYKDEAQCQLWLIALYTKTWTTTETSYETTGTCVYW